MYRDHELLRVLVCGGRDWGGEFAVELVLSHIHSSFGISVVMSGCAAGADTMAMQWANRHGVKFLPFRANWDLHGALGGRRRNREMARRGKPSLVVAFPGGNGTDDMIMVARRLGIPIWKFGGFILDCVDQMDHSVIFIDNNGETRGQQ